MHEGHSHNQTAAQAGESRLRIVLLLTASYLIVEVIAAFATNSLALLADAGHMLADVAGIALALVAIRFARRPANRRNTYGYYRLEMLAALANGVLLLGIAVYILFESYQRFADPPDFDGRAMLVVAGLGLVVNVIAAYLLLGAQKTSLNMRGAYLEVLADLVGSIAVIVAGVIFIVTGFGLVDVLASVFIGLFILPRTWNLIHEAIHVLLEGTPRDMDIEDLREHILGTAGVESVHDLHAWNLTSGMKVMSAHVVITPDAESQQILDALCSCLGEHFDVEHSTFQIESPDRSATERTAH